MVLLVETWLDNTRLASVRDKLQMGNYFGVSKMTRDGGLAFFLKKDVELDFESLSINHIEDLINKGKEDTWRFTGFYGNPETQLRVESWDLLRDLYQ